MLTSMIHTMVFRIASAVVVAGAVVIAGVPSAADAASTALVPPQARFTYTVIADSADGYDGDPQFGCAALNASGQIAFHSRQYGSEQILLSDGATTTVMADDRFYDSTLDLNPSVNDIGQVSFETHARGVDKIVRSDGTTTDILATTAGRFAQFDLGTAINGAGRVAFKANLDNGDQAVFAVRSQGHFGYEIKNKGRWAHHDTAESVPSVRGKKIAFETYTGGLRNTILRADDAQHLVVIAGQNVGGLPRKQRPSLGPHGRVAYLYTDVDTPVMFASVIVATSESDSVEIADIDGPYGSLSRITTFESELLDGPSMNGVGGIVFDAALDGSSSYGIYSGPDPSHDRVIGPGNRLAGSSVATVYSCSQALNDNGSVAFRATLADGRVVIARADPIR